MVQEVCRDLAVSLYPCGGFASITLAYEAAQEMRNTHRYTGRQPLILFIGDYDPAGVLIDQALENELRTHLDDTPMYFERLAVTEEQISAWDLPAKPCKKGDMRESIEAMLPDHPLEVYKAAEESDRQNPIRMAELLERNP